MKKKNISIDNNHELLDLKPKHYSLKFLVNKLDNIDKMKSDRKLSNLANFNYKKSNEKSENVSFSEKDNHSLNHVEVLETNKTNSLVEKLSNEILRNKTKDSLNEPEEVEITEDDENMLRKNIQSVFPRLNYKEITKFIQNFFYQDFLINTSLIEGSETMFFYIIKQGKVGLYKGNELKKT